MKRLVTLRTAESGRAKYRKYPEAEIADAEAELFAYALQFCN
jgi:hypothetical protein